MTLDIQFRIRVKDLLDHIDHEFGGIEKLGAYLRKHPDDSARILQHEAALRNADKPNKVLTFGQMYIGDPRQVVNVAKVEVLEFLMRHPGTSLRELARAMDRNPATISEHLEELEHAGLILKESRGAGRPVALRALPREIQISLRGGAEGAVA
ncbi:MAG: HVO_A0114 family putative DNA-binding protein [Thermoplasmatota archaeon]